MKWLVGYTFAGLVGSVIVVRVMEFLVWEGRSVGSSVAKAGVFVGTWTTIIAALGMRDFSSKVRLMRGKKKGVIMRRPR